MNDNKFTLMVSCSEPRFIVSDNIFYDYGIGKSLSECLQDYVVTLQERLEIMQDDGYDKNDSRFALLQNMLKEHKT